MIKAHTSNSKENQSQSASATNSEVQSSEESKSEFVDNRPQTIAQRKLQGSANNSPKGNISSQMQNGGESTFQFVDNRPQTIAQRKLQGIANNSPLAKGVVQLQPTTVLQRNPGEDFKKSKNTGDAQSTPEEAGKYAIKEEGGEKGLDNIKGASGGLSTVASGSESLLKLNDGLEDGTEKIPGIGVGLDSIGKGAEALRSFIYEKDKPITKWVDIGLKGVMALSSGYKFIQSIIPKSVSFPLVDVIDTGLTLFDNGLQHFKTSGFIEAIEALELVAGSGLSSKYGELKENLIFKKRENIMNGVLNLANFIAYVADEYLAPGVPVYKTAVNVVSLVKSGANLVTMGINSFYEHIGRKQKAESNTPMDAFLLTPKGRKKYPEFEKPLKAWTKDGGKFENYKSNKELIDDIIINATKNMKKYLPIYKETFPSDFYLRNPDDLNPKEIGSVYDNDQFNVALKTFWGKYT